MSASDASCTMSATPSDDALSLSDRVPRVSFGCRPPLLNATLSKRDAELAASAVLGEERSDRAIEDLHSYIREVWSVPYVATFLGGRAALYAIIRALDLQPGDQVLVPAFTCQAVTNAFSFNSIEVIFVDIELDTFGMDVALARKAITHRTKAILLQHTFGLVCRDTAALCEMARSCGLRIIEDCAHATGGAYHGAMLGTLGDVGFFSSERSKVVNTIHGGWVVSKDHTVGERLTKVYDATPEPEREYTVALLQTLCREWRKCQADTGKSEISTRLDRVLSKSLVPIPQMQTTELSGLFTRQYRSRMPRIVATLLEQQLRRLPEILARRRAGAAYWEKWSTSGRVLHARPIKGSDSTWLRFPILVESAVKADTSTLADTIGCDVGVWFTTPMHPQPLTLPDCPVGMFACKHCVNLPTWLPEE